MTSDDVPTLLPDLLLGLSTTRARCGSGAPSTAADSPWRAKAKRGPSTPASAWMKA